MRRQKEKWRWGGEGGVGIGKNVMMWTFHIHEIARVGFPNLDACGRGGKRVCFLSVFCVHHKGMVPKMNAVTQ